MFMEGKVEININKTKNAKYPYRSTFSINGKRWDYRGKTKGEVVKKARNKIKQLNVIKTDYTIKEWSEYCITTYKAHLKPNTLVKYRSRMNTCIISVIGGNKIQNITPEDFQACLNKQVAKSQYMIDQTWQMLNFLANKAIGENIIHQNPLVYCSKPKGYKQSRRALTSKEQELVDKVIPLDRRFNIYLLMLHCGCRPSEASNCKGENIIEREGRTFIHIKGTKSASADRYVPVPDAIKPTLSAIPKDEYIACTSSGHKIEEYYQKKVWNRFKRELHIAAGGKLYRNQIIENIISPDLIPYMLRHTYCTNLAKKGIDIRIAQYLMGHSDISLTANCYTHLELETLLNEVRI